MGEIAEMMLDGTLCEGCGEFLNEAPLGHPDRCANCREDALADERREQAEHRPNRKKKKKKRKKRRGAPP